MFYCIFRISVTKNVMLFQQQCVVPQTYKNLVRTQKHNCPGKFTDKPEIVNLRLSPTTSSTRRTMYFIALVHFNHAHQFSHL